MKNTKWIELTIAVVLLLTAFACSSSTEGDEESGTHFAIDETCYEVKNGVRLIIAYVDSVDAFVGTVENVTNGLIPDVRVEVHLSTGTELGPTPYTDLSADQIETVTLDVNGEMFEWWSVHAEVEED